MFATESLDPRETPMAYTVNSEAATVLASLVGAERFKNLGLHFSGGWPSDKNESHYRRGWGKVSTWNGAILQGPSFYCMNPFYQTPNATMKNQRDWAPLDLETLQPDEHPATTLKPSGPLIGYMRDYTQWSSGPASRRYRVAWRRMAANTGERTLIPTIIPPGATHVDSVYSAACDEDRHTVHAAAVLGSLISDFIIRSSPKNDIRTASIERLPCPSVDHPLSGFLALRALRLNTLTETYAELWAECWDDSYALDSWTSDSRTSTRLGLVERGWSSETPLRRASDRRQAQVEIDALVALMLGVSADQVCMVYRTQFPVLHGYDHDEYTYDASGRIVPNPVLVAYRKKGDRITLEERTHQHPAGATYVYELPFSTYDREYDMRVAYAEFERRLAEGER